MSNMLSATEQARPVMGYVRELEAKVLNLRQELSRRRRSRFETFVFGVATGGVVSWMVVAMAWYLSRHH